MATATLARKKTRFEYLEDNDTWMDFRRKLEARGITIRWMWQAKSGPRLKHPNIHCCMFVGDGFAPSIGTAVIVDYCVGRLIDSPMGFGIFTDRGDGTIDADVEAICKPR